MVDPEDMELAIARGGAVSDMVADMILLCGGRYRHMQWCQT